MSKRGWLIAFALCFPTVVTYAHFVAVSPGEPTANPRLQVLYATGKLIELALPIIYFAMTRTPASWPILANSLESKKRLGSLQGMGLGILFGVAVGATILALYQFWLVNSPVLAIAATQVRAKVIEFGFDTPANFVAFALFLSLAHSLLEEYYWRWFAFGGLRATWPFWPAALLASFAFMGHHVVVLSVYFPGAFWTAVLPFSAGVAIGGVVWCWLYERSGSLVAPWLSHALIDAAIMIVGYRLLFGRS